MFFEDYTELLVISGLLMTINNVEQHKKAVRFQTTAPRACSDGV